MNYYVSTSVFLGPPERGTFSNKDFEKGELIAIAVEVPRVYQRPDLEWKFYDFIKMTNHSEDIDNMEPLYKTDKRGKLLVYVKAKRYIKKDEELLFNYKSLPFSDKIDMSFLDKNANKVFLYHFFNEEGLKLFKRHGLCSARRLHDYDKDLYMSTIYKKYIKYAIDFFSDCPMLKEPITIPDNLVLEYLDRIEPEHISSESLYFSLIPLDKFNEEYKNDEFKYEVKIDILKLKVYPKIIFIDGNKKVEMKLDEVKNDSIVQLVEDRASGIPEHGCSRDMFYNVPYICIKRGYYISYELFHIDRESL